MAESIHMLELPIEIEPLRPRPERWPPFMPDVGISAAVVEFRARIAAALRKLFKDFAGPPMEVGIDDPHAGYSVLCLALILNLDRPGRADWVKFRRCDWKLLLAGRRRNETPSSGNDCEHAMNSGVKTHNSDAGFAAV